MRTNRIYRRIAAHLGVRGYALLLCAFIWGNVAAGIPGSLPNAPDSTFHANLPIPLATAVWGAPAALALAAAIWRHRLVVWAMGGLMLAPSLWAASYVSAWVMALIPGDPPGYAGGLRAAGFYMAMMAIVGLAAHVREPTRRPRLPDYARPPGDESRDGGNT